MPDGGTATAPANEATAEGRDAPGLEAAFPEGPGVQRSPSLWGKSLLHSPQTDLTPRLTSRAGGALHPRSLFTRSSPPWNSCAGVPPGCSPPGPQTGVSSPPPPELPSLRGMVTPLSGKRAGLGDVHWTHSPCSEARGPWSEPCAPPACGGHGARGPPVLSPSTGSFQPLTLVPSSG